MTPNTLQIHDLPTMLSQLRRDRFYGRVSFDLRAGEVTLVRTERTQLVQVSTNHQGEPCYGKPSGR
jgi:hypothetical protein